MIYNSQNELDANKARVKLDFFIKEGKVFELKEKRFNRSQKQNRALHLFFQMLSTELNDLGLEFTYSGLNVESISLMYTPELVKNFFWRPIQIALFDIQSTTEINTYQINQILDVIIKFIGERGVYVEFPNKELLIEQGK
jgi:hypothetical protein